MDNKELNEIFSSNDDVWTEYLSKQFININGQENNRVVLYGAGKIGTAFYGLLKSSIHYNVIMWVDRNYKIYSDIINSPSKINEVEYDYIIVAVKDERTVNEITNDLEKSGVPKNKIIPYYAIQRESKLDVLFRNKYNEMNDAVYWIDSHQNLNYDKPYSITSMICNQSFFDAPFFQFWADKVHNNFVDLMMASGQLSLKCLDEKVVYHRKLWEFVYICEALYERGFLTPGNKGVAFGVGTECLPDLFASMGCEVLATDLNAQEAEKKGWTAHAENINGNYWELNKYGFCDKDTFAKMVKYRDLDMNNIPKDIIGYDFCWSACALEHIGGICAGLDFIKNSLNVLRPGGIAVHTTEYNLFSDERTFETDGLSLFRRKDIEQLTAELQKSGHYVYPIDWHIGSNVVDGFIDIPPYSKKDMHLRLKIQEFPSTSIGLIIKKAELNN